MFISQAKHKTVGNVEQHKAWELYVLADNAQDCFWLLPAWQQLSKWCLLWVWSKLVMQCNFER
jgi:hypothetical protein